MLLCTACGIVHGTAWDFPVCPLLPMVPHLLSGTLVPHSLSGSRVPRAPWHPHMVPGSLVPCPSTGFPAPWTLAHFLAPSPSLAFRPWLPGTLQAFWCLAPQLASRLPRPLLTFWVLSPRSLPTLAPLAPCRLPGYLSFLASHWIPGYMTLCWLPGPMAPRWLPSY